MLKPGLGLRALPVPDPDLHTRRGCWLLDVLL
jgi:hypothetical protein